MPPLVSDGNPVLRRELLNVLRSKKAFVLMFVYAAALIGIVYIAWPPAGDPRAVQSEKTRILFNIFARGQMVMIAMLGPAFSAGCVTVEKERRSLDMLLTTPLRGGALLSGKYLSSAAYLALLTAATAPMVASFLYLPGLDPEEIAGLYVFLLAEACCFSMVGLTASVFLPRTQSALSVAYLAILPVSALLLLVSLAFPRFFHIGAAIWPSGVMAVAILFMYAACRVRIARPFDPAPRSLEDEENSSSQSGLVLMRDRFPDKLLIPSRREEPMEDGANPVLYKEMRCEVFGRGTFFLRIIIQVSMFMSLVFLTFLLMGREHIFVYYLIAFGLLAAPAFACDAFTGERERGTLDMLLTTLLAPRRIVLGKFLASYRLSMMLTGLVGMAMLFYLFVPTQDAPAGFVERLARLCIYVLIVGATVLFETVAAMFVSLLCRTTTASMVTSYAVVFLALVAPVAAEAILRVFTHVRMEEIARYLVTCPFAAAYSVAARGGGEISPLWIPYLAITLSASAALLGVMMKWMRPIMDRVRPAG